MKLNRKRDLQAFIEWIEWQRGVFLCLYSRHTVTILRYVRVVHDKIFLPEKVNYEKEVALHSRQRCRRFSISA